jgi:hypothetical protein
MEASRTIVVVCLAVAAMILIAGCAVNGRPMRFDPHGQAGKSSPKASSWLIEGKTPNGADVSCSFVEFDERGDFLDFNQHIACEAAITNLVTTLTNDGGRLLLVLYCHGWKNNSQSGDVVEFNAFLSRLAASKEIRDRKLRVHGVYLGWRGNPFRPYVEMSEKNQSYKETEAVFGGPIVDQKYHRCSWLGGVIPETLSYWNRKGAAEFRVSGLPMARAIFTYAAIAKDHGKLATNRVCVIGHSFGALMLERSLGQAMTGALTMDWDKIDPKTKEPLQPQLPLDMVLFVNSAAPAIYAKEMRDFLKAYQSGLNRNHNPAADVPVIVSLTSTADWATGMIHPIGNCLAPFDLSLQRRYTTGIVGEKTTNGYPTHTGVRQSEFYRKTPGHQPYLINHWIKKDDAALPPDSSPDAVFSANLTMPVKDADLFFTSKAKYPASAWRITQEPQGKPVTLDGMKPSMSTSDYWIMSCGKELINGHNDVWSPTTMEMYAALFRAVESRRGKDPVPGAAGIAGH